MFLLKNFHRDDNEVMGREVRSAMIKAAFSGELVFDEVVNLIQCEEACEEHLPAILFGLSKATASFLKSLEKSGIAGRRLYEGMIDVWLNDVDDDYDYFKNWIRDMNERRLGIK